MNNHSYAPARRAVLSRPVRRTGVFSASLLMFAAVAAFSFGMPGTVRAASPDFLYTFNSPGALAEAGSMSGSSSPYFWVNSGAYLVIKDGVGGTVHGALDAFNWLRVLYGKMNPLDTDNGYYPQNTFRLVSTWTWGSAETGISFIIDAFNETDTPHRGPYSGVLLMSRYQDGNNLYYAGVRNDGLAVIKKKIGGTYYTLAAVQIFGVDGQYEKSALPSLLPQGKWTGMKFAMQNRADGSVYLRLLLDRENDGSYVSILSALDSGTGGAPILSGHSGIRTDYLDARFENFRVVNL